MNDPILIKKHDKNKTIEYPETELPMALFQGTERREDDDKLYDRPDLTGYKDAGFDISHLETLMPYVRYVRGLVKYNGEVYVFSTKVDLMKTLLCKLDIDSLLQAVTLRIKDGEYVE